MNGLKIFIIFSLLITASACGSKDGSESDESINNGVAMQAAGWSDLKLVTQVSEIHGGAEVHISPFGHFSAKPNACWQEGTSPILLQIWNPLTQALNELAADSVTDKESCFPAASSNDRFDGAAEIKLTNGKTMEVLNSRAGVNGLEICTKMRNVQAATVLTQSLDKILPGAPTAGSCVTH